MRIGKEPEFHENFIKDGFMKTSLRLPRPIPFLGRALNRVPGAADSLLA
jgi:hypothetical protein